MITTPAERAAHRAFLDGLHMDLYDTAGACPVAWAHICPHNVPADFEDTAHIRDYIRAARELGDIITAQQEAAALAYFRRTHY